MPSTQRYRWLLWMSGVLGAAATIIRPRAGSFYKTRTLNHFICQATRTNLVLDLPLTVEGLEQLKSADTQCAIVTVHTDFAFAAHAPMVTAGLKPVWVGHVTKQIDGFNWNTNTPVRMLHAKDASVLLKLSRAVSPVDIPVAFIDAKRNIELDRTTDYELNPNMLKLANRQCWQLFFLYVQLESDGALTATLHKLLSSTENSHDLSNQQEQIVEILQRVDRRAVFQSSAHRS